MVLRNLTTNLLWSPRLMNSLRVILLSVSLSMLTAPPVTRTSNLRCLVLIAELLKSSIRGRQACKKNRKYIPYFKTEIKIHFKWYNWINRQEMNSGWPYIWKFYLMSFLFHYICFSDSNAYFPFYVDFSRLF